MMGVVQLSSVKLKEGAEQVRTTVLLSSTVSDTLALMVTFNTGSAGMKHSHLNGDVPRLMVRLPHIYIVTGMFPNYQSMFRKDWFSVLHLQHM